MNEIAEEDVTWIEAFGAACSARDDAADARTERVVFCIDVGDFVPACGPLARARAAGRKIAVCQMDGAADGAADGGGASGLRQRFEAAVAALQDGAGSGGAACCLCLPGMPLFGEPLRIAVAVPLPAGAARLPESVADALASLALAVRYAA